MKRFVIGATAVAFSMAFAGSALAEQTKLSDAQLDHVVAGQLVTADLSGASVLNGTSLLSGTAVSALNGNTVAVPVTAHLPVTANVPVSASVPVTAPISLGVGVGLPGL